MQGSSPAVWAPERHSLASALAPDFMLREGLLHFSVVSYSYSMPLFSWPKNSQPINPGTASSHGPEVNKPRTHTPKVSQCPRWNFEHSPTWVILITDFIIVLDHLRVLRKLPSPRALLLRRKQALNLIREQLTSQFPHCSWCSDHLLCTSSCWTMLFPEPWHYQGTVLVDICSGMIRRHKS